MDGTTRSFRTPVNDSRGRNVSTVVLAGDTGLLVHGETGLHTNTHTRTQTLWYVAMTTEDAALDEGRPPPSATLLPISPECVSVRSCSTCPERDGDGGTGWS